MGKHKSYPAICPWLSARVDNHEKRFIQVGNSLFFSSAFTALHPGARYLYLCMAMESAGRTEFEFPERAARKYNFSSSSFRRYISELASHGFIHVDSMKNLRRDNRYRFLISWKLSSALPAMAIYSKSDPK